ncbi:Helix-turn-helix domain of resolvase [Gemmata obscuriglobus]|uniref:Uncharacterized protein n=1 Tax=Gemmata obscuriglobus TaxID=114 RepID=A0A2Z3HBV7_9BACT|nr:hypothetical protein [Gemmata obscuriglobus]AWM38690.1 hypothetical protein C1280_17985 [Gemmata obscuriglobus]QEG28344.1 Helix-turn-helix domain of resolvase [Gemmata obscuriglobus]VTS06225.1 unnamed protein product [Gemmata obscuriglobus UQM 2246]
MAGGREWTTGEEAELKRLLAAGTKLATVAKRLNRSYSAVAQRAFRVSGRERLPRLHKAGELEERVRSLSVPGVPDAVVAGILGVTRQTVLKTRQRLGIPQSVPPNGKLPRDPAKRSDLSIAAKVLWLYSGVGRSDVVIAKRIGVSRTTVRDYRLKFNLPALGELKCGRATTTEVQK